MLRRMAIASSHRALLTLACQSGATGDFTAISSPDMCIGAVLASPIFVSSDMIICGTVGLDSMTSASSRRRSSSSIGKVLNFNFFSHVLKFPVYCII